jgi:hypothetical protein
MEFKKEKKFKQRSKGSRKVFQKKTSFDDAIN